MSWNNTCLQSGVFVGDDFTPCGRHLVLDAVVPFTVASLSLLYFLVRLVIRNTASQYQVKDVIDPETHRLLSTVNTRETAATEQGYGTIKLDDEEPTITQRHFDIKKLVHRNEDGSEHGHVKLLYRSTSEKLRVALEELMLIINFALSLGTVFYEPLHKEWLGSKVPFIQVFVWGYALLVCTIRLLNISSSGSRQLPNLWRQSVLLYSFTFLASCFTFRSVLIGSIDDQVLAYYYKTYFVACTILVCSIYTASIGDKPARLYVTSDGAAPSPEKTTSLLNLMTYDWLTAMVIKAYRSGLQINDVWSLSEEDYAFNIVQGFEKMQSSYKFMGRLFKYFKTLLLVQAFWTCLDSFLVFAPSILLKKILEYVDDQQSNPKSLAWLFVFLLLFFKLASSSVSGRSLFLGRKLCIRLKAIIIGEVYAKALRRKVTLEQVAKSSDDGAEDDKNSLAEVTTEAVSSSDSNESTEADQKKPAETSSADLGSIINLMAVDAFKVSEISGYLHYFVSAILMIFIAISLLYKLLGWSAFVGSFVIILLLPLNYKATELLGSYQREMLGVTDKRIQKLNEAFQNIRIIKFFAWEDKFAEEILKVRDEELYKLKIRCIIWSLSAILWFITPTLITLVSFYCYIIIDGNTLTAPIAFTSLSLFNLLRNPLEQIADMSSFVIQSKVSLDRVQKFLDEEDTTKYEQLSHPRNASSPVIGFENASFGWSKNSTADFKLRDLNIDFKIGKLNVIIGPTGAGKTSLLLALLGEMELLDGQVHLPGTEPRDELIPDVETGLSEAVAYCSQAAWLLNDTIKNNIVFAAPFNQERYDAVVEACGLVRDFEILDSGDETEVGEKGITLSGGQKQRVSLARALYSSARHVLLDDCLSAVDSHTALWIYENCITGPLMKNRTCILVSHNVALTVTEAEWVVVLDNGRVKSQGTPDLLLEKGDLGDDELVKASVMSRVASTANFSEMDTKKNLKNAAAKIEAKLKKIVSEEAGEQELLKDLKPLSKKKLIQEETSSTGNVKMSVYTGYGKEFGTPFIWTMFFTLMIACQFIYMYQSWWLKIWSAASESAAGAFAYSIVSFGYQPLNSFHKFLINFDWFKPIGGESFRVMEAGTHSTLFYILVYSGIGVLYSMASSLRVLIVFFGGLVASKSIFEKMLYRVLRAKLRFFDSTPIGRVMNRFSKDIESVDQELAACAEGFLMCLVQCLGVIILICAITPAFVLFAFLVSFLYYLVGIFYLSASRELKRFDSVTRSPIHQHFTETLVGVPTIRAYGDERRFMLQNLHKIDGNNKPFFYLWVANRWLSWRIDFVGALVSFFAGVLVLLSVEKLDAGLAGLSLSYGIAFSDSALWVVRLYSNVEMNMNSVERLQEYMIIDQEPPEYIPETEPASSWPDKGEIEVKDLSLRYAPDLPKVIDNVTFTVEPNSKVGIVGRTGAGKSTIITAFFRFLDPETGSIMIDGVDITKIGLKTLRQGITIIPQDPTLFTGTVRSNLDMFNQYSDNEMFVALKRVNLITPEEYEAIQSGTLSDNASGENKNKFLDLESGISEGGSNLSQGQRQLMCLARSLLKSPKVILLDEATASIDYLSDAKIQHTIRDEFSNSTILTIAHRLRSIIDYDKILVMDAGKVVEYEDPYSLIINKDSLFHSMCENSGELDILIQLAKDAFVKKRQQPGE